MTEDRTVEPDIDEAVRRMANTPGPEFVSLPPEFGSEKPDIMTRARMARGGRGAVDPVGSTKYSDAAANWKEKDKVTTTVEFGSEEPTRASRTVEKRKVYEGGEQPYCAKCEVYHPPCVR